MQWIQSLLLVLVEVLVLFWLRDWNESYDWWKSFFSDFFWSHRLNLELLLEATMCTKKYGTQNLEKDVRVESNNCFYKFVVFVGKEINLLDIWRKERRENIQKQLLQNDNYARCVSLQCCNCLDCNMIWRMKNAWKALII